MRFLPLQWLLLSLWLVSPAALAKDFGSERFGDYEIHYSVFPSLFLDAKIAARYKLVRGPAQGIVNISVRQIKSQANTEQAARITGEFRDLLRSYRLQFKEIREQGAIYYLANFKFSHRDLLNFTVEVFPEQHSRSYTVRWQRKMYNANR